MIQQEVLENYSVYQLRKAEHRDFRLGDVRHSLADISKAKSILGYKPTHKVTEGIKETVKWHIENS